MSWCNCTTNAAIWLVYLNFNRVQKKLSRPFHVGKQYALHGKGLACETIKHFWSLVSIHIFFWCSDLLLFILTAPIFPSNNWGRLHGGQVACSGHVINGDQRLHEGFNLQNKCVTVSNQQQTKHHLPTLISAATAAPPNSGTKQTLRRHLLSSSLIYLMMHTYHRISPLKSQVVTYSGKNTKGRHQNSWK